MVEQVDSLFFKILILGGLSDNYGNIWKKVSQQICVVECTLTKLDISKGAWTNKQKSVSTMLIVHSQSNISCVDFQGTTPKCLLALIIFSTNTMYFSKRSASCISIQRKRYFTFSYMAFN